MKAEIALRLLRHELQPPTHPQPFFSLFYQHSQSSHLQGGSAAFLELDFLVCCFHILSRSRKWSERLSKKWTLNVTEIIVLIAPVCDLDVFSCCQLFQLLRGYLWTMMSPLSPLCPSCLFHGSCFHPGLIDARWAASELSATPAEPSEIGFLLAPEHFSVRGTTAQPKHTPSSRWLCSETQCALCT